MQRGSVFGTMAYDGTGRRVSQAVTGQGTSGNMAMHSYYSDGHQILEERNGSGQTLKQHVWGSRYVDELVQTGINTDPADGGEQNVEAFYTVLQDANFNVTGIVNTSGALVERYDYDAYGERTVYTSGGSNDPGLYAMSDQSARVAVGGVEQAYGLMDFGHQGLLHDNATGLVYNRARYLSTELDRFMQQDPLGYVDGANWYLSYKAQPISSLDPFGNTRYVFVFEGLEGYNEGGWDRWRKGLRPGYGPSPGFPFGETGYVLEDIFGTTQEPDWLPGGAAPGASGSLSPQPWDTVLSYFSEKDIGAALAYAGAQKLGQQKKWWGMCYYDTVIVIGHSYGGDAAWNLATQLQKMVRGKGIITDLGMTLDPVKQGSTFGRNRDWDNPAPAFEWLNWYRDGRTMGGASQNIEAPRLFADPGHVGIIGWAKNSNPLFKQAFTSVGYARTSLEARDYITLPQVQIA